MKFPIPRTLYARLILSHLLVALIGIILISVFAGQSIFNASREQVQNSYEDLAFAATNDLEQPLLDMLSGQGSPEQVRAVIDKWFSHIPDLRYSLYLPGGEPLVGSGVELPPPADPGSDPEIWDALQTEMGEGEEIRLNDQGVETLYLAMRVDHSDEIYGVLRLEIPISNALFSARRSLALLLLTNLVVTLGVSIFAYLLARSLSKPIISLTETAERLSQGDLSARAPTPANPKELSRLAWTFNAMAARLQDNVDELRTFVANASHELRTPLTSVKLRVEALRDGAMEEDRAMSEKFLSEIESEVDRLSRMVNDMLDLSRIEAGLASKERTPLHLSNIAGEVCETFSARAERAGVTMNLSIETGLPWIMGNEDQLRRMIYNLVDNAIKYTNRGGRVDLMLKMCEQGDCVQLLVKDSGYGIAAKHLPHIFERFYRVEATRPRYGPPQGSGLGLPIAKSIVETHGGKISVSSIPEVGTTFVVELPTKKLG